MNNTIRKLKIATKMADKDFAVIVKRFSGKSTFVFTRHNGVMAVTEYFFGENRGHREGVLAEICWDIFLRSDEEDAVFLTVDIAR